MNSFEGNRNSFMEELHNNPGTLVFKFGAEWCAPCNKIKDFVGTLVEESLKTRPDGSLVFYEVDVDECIDVYGFLKSKKMIRGIPAIMLYDKGNESYIPDSSVSGSDNNDILTFFRTINNKR